jgi:uncharacterized protein YcfJ
MKIKLTSAALAALVSVGTMMPDAAFARHHRYRGYTNHYRSACSGGDGAVGTIGGGVGGALIGHAVGGGTVGTIAGGVGGALLGRHLDKQNTRRRSGC